jgi:hypothetical protein
MAKHLCVLLGASMMYSELQLVLIQVALQPRLFAMHRKIKQAHVLLALMTTRVRLRIQVALQAHRIASRV